MQQKPFLVFGIIFLLLTPLAFSGLILTASSPLPKVQTGGLLSNYLLPFLFFVNAYVYWKLNNKSIRMTRGFFLSHLTIGVILFEYITHLPVLVFKFWPGMGMNFMESFSFAFALNIVFNGLYLLILFLALLFKKTQPQTT